MTLLRHMTWNQGDQGVSPDRGWDIACLTERSKAGPPGWAERYTSRLLKGLAIDWNPDVFEVDKTGASLAHIGMAKFSPNRGTLWATGRLVETGQKVAVLCAHRINDPDGSERSFGPVRKLLWGTHAALDRRLIDRFERRGHLVFYGGDVNHRTDRLEPLHRVLMGRYDALAHTPDAAVTVVDVKPGPQPQGHAHRMFTAHYDIRPHKETR